MNMCYFHSTNKYVESHYFTQAIITIFSFAIILDVTFFKRTSPLIASSEEPFSPTASS